MKVASERRKEASEREREERASERDGGASEQKRRANEKKEEQRKIDANHIRRIKERTESKIGFKKNSDKENE